MSALFLFASGPTVLFNYLFCEAALGVADTDGIQENFFNDFDVLPSISSYFSTPPCPRHLFSCIYWTTISA